MQIIILLIVGIIYLMAIALYSFPGLLKKTKYWNDRFKKVSEINGDKYYYDDKVIAFVKELFDGMKNVSIGTGFLVGVSIMRNFSVNGVVVGFLSIIGPILIYLPFFVWSLKIIKALDLRNHKIKIMPEIVILSVGSIAFIVFFLYCVFKFS